MNCVVSRKHERIGVPYTPELAKVFPQGVAVGPWLAVPHGPGETKLLRNMGLDAPAPVLSQYDWEGGAPFEVQKKTVAMLTTEPRAYVLSGMGTGKTRCPIWAFSYLRSKGLASRMLVVAPLSTLSFVWAAEVFKVAPQYKVAVIHHALKEKRLERLHGDWDIAVINHDGVSTIYKEILKLKDLDVLVLDELAVYRSGPLQAIEASRRRWPRSSAGCGA